MVSGWACRPTESSVVPERTYRAPGRVNLIGDHTDYNDGFVLPLAIDRECVIGADPTGLGRELVVVRSLEQLAGEVSVPADGSVDPAARRLPGWGRYVAGVVRVLAKRARDGPPLASTQPSRRACPFGAGLSSSAALLSCALRSPCAPLPRSRSSPSSLRAPVRRPSRAATGVPSGIMDQLTAIAGQTRRGPADRLPKPRRRTGAAPAGGRRARDQDGHASASSRTARTQSGGLPARRQRQARLSSLRDATPDQVAATRAPVTSSPRTPACSRPPLPSRRETSRLGPLLFGATRACATTTRCRHPSSTTRRAPGGRRARSPTHRRRLRRLRRRLRRPGGRGRGRRSPHERGPPPAARQGR